MTTGTTGTRPQSLKERQREERERLILRAAEELLIERGYHETSIDDIAARVGISKGTVYLHFSSKEDLVVALLERRMRDFIGAIDAKLSAPGTPSDKLRSIIELTAGAVPDQHAHLVGAMFQTPEMHTRLAEQMHALRALWEQPMRRVAALIDEGKASGEFDPTLPTQVVVVLFASLLTPHTRRRALEQEGMPPDEVVRHLIRFFFKGIAADARPR